MPLDTLNEAVLREMPIKMLELRRDLKIFGSYDLAGFEIVTGINVKARGVFEKLAETAEEPAFTVVVKAFVENFGQFGCPDGEAERLFGVTR